MRPDYCPIGGEPCQSVCIEPCSTKRRRVSYVCPICAASMIESDEALLRQVLEVLGRAHHVAMKQTLKARIPECGEFAGIAQDLDFVVATLRERLGEKA